ncbi:SRPBCC family protein [Solitalea lacus]|uniref:SRPBCC family protein n=1 Tax=Solitalea lacus TaxID=2911172 RepID=UPI001EDC121B|nr:SRPBCC family protein [Solitalea lacus]UKJ08541.1 SRPBCC family protein [Solitalea lacus]
MIAIKILVVLIAIISVALVIAMFSRKNYTLKRETVVNRPRQEVFDFIKLNKNQKKYSKWLNFDPATKIEFKGAHDGTPGSILCFESRDQKTGKGEWEIKKVVDGSRVDFELRFLAPFVFTANGYFELQTVSSNQTNVKWVYNSGMNWPMNFMLLFLDMEKLVGKDLGESLNNIKTTLEK